MPEGHTASTVLATLFWLSAYVAIGPSIALLAHRRKDHFWSLALLPPLGVAILARQTRLPAATTLFSFVAFQAMLGFIAAFGGVLFGRLNVPATGGPVAWDHSGALTLVGWLLTSFAPSLPYCLFMAALWGRLCAQTGVRGVWAWVAALPFIGAVGAGYLAAKAPMPRPPSSQSLAGAGPEPAR